MTEPCPFCRARIKPLVTGKIKQCPACRGRWMESGNNWGADRTTPYTGGGGIAAVA